MIEAKVDNRVERATEHVAVGNELYSQVTSAHIDPGVMKFMRELEKRKSGAGFLINKLNGQEKPQETLDAEMEL